MNLTCLIVDDEAPGRMMLEQYVRDTPFLALAGSAASARSAAEILAGKRVDLLFLDIQMPKTSGIDFLRSLENPPLVIMVTAHSEYALQGYELDVIDYLLKPVSKERFVKACQKASDYLEMKSGTQDDSTTDHFFIKCSTRFERINFSDLLFAEASNNYVVLHTGERSFTTYLTFKSVEDHLAKRRFMKVHKSYIVNLDKIESIDGENISLAGHKIPISRALRAPVMDHVLNTKVIRR